MPRHVAGIMLAGILSDTLNLQSPTTTSWDKRMVTMLVQLTGLDDVNMYAASQFRAKSRQLLKMSPYALVHGDMKQFKFNSSSSEEEVYSIGYSVIETTDAASSLARAEELLEEMKHARDDMNLTAMLLAIVDIVHLSSKLLICGIVEESLAVAAYGGEIDLEHHTLTLPGKVSRKKDFIPPIARVIQQDGWTPPRVLGKNGRRRSSTIVMSYKDFANGQPIRVMNDDDDEEDGEQIGKEENGNGLMI